jgi:hypothetical protein
MFSEYFGMRWNELIGTTIKRTGIYPFKAEVSTIYCGPLVLRGYTVYFAADLHGFRGDYFDAVPVLVSSNS